MIRACVIGWPISHSRSPLIHNYWLEHYGIAGSYTRNPVRPEDLPDFIIGLATNGYAGCNCTIPHKEAVFALLPAADDNTRRIGAVNTVFMREGQVLGTNTDGAGFLANLAAHTSLEPLRARPVIMLGAGGAALAIAAVLQDAGFTEIAVANRTPERTEALRHRLGGCITLLRWDHVDAALADCGLLVNTTALGMNGQPPLDLALDRLPPTAAVADIVYTPLETTLLKRARDRGNITVPGLGMLLHQAVGGFELWFGRRPTVTTELYDLVARDVDPDWKGT